jgi:BirA family biotin operon repressor/biotin-[acetyl-CoA-carboxylase] ligase
MRIEPERLVAPWIRSVQLLDSAPSTNDLARARLLRENADLPLLVWTHLQTAGRGREARPWFSDPGSWTFSIALDPRDLAIPPHKESRIGLAAAVAVIAALNTHTPLPRLGLRWPNDLEIDDRKLGGILPERFESPFGPRFVLGIGLNINTNFTLAPPEIQRLAVSLAELHHPIARPEPLLSVLLAELERALSALATDDPALPAAWARLDLLNGRPVQIALGPDLLSGTARGIAPDGALLLEQHDGAISPLYGGQVLRA